VEAARRAPDSARARALYEDALSLYRGDYLADLDGDLLDCWIDRERLNEHYLNATLELASLYAAEGEGDLAQELCLQVLAVDTCREDAVELLMRLSLRRGDRAAALGYYHRLTECMLRELGLGPSLQIEHILDETASPHEPSPRT
jgi:DNA-binding SARP family transcriptional activator